MKINSTIFFTIASLFYITLLIVAYFSKARMRTAENKVYSKLIVVNLISIILELMCTIFAGYASEHLLFYKILNKMFLISLITWGSIFGIYVFLISEKKKTKEELKKYMNNVLKLYISLISIISILVIVLPIEFQYRDGYVMYSYGPSANVVYGGIFISILLMLICMLKNFKNIISKKYLPIYAYLLIGTITTIVQKMVPELLLATTMDAFITVIMYFTIENPDKKLLEEIHTSKKLAESANEDKSMFIYNMMSEVRSIASDINKSSEIILSSNNIEENRFFAREIIASNSRLYSMANDIYNIDVLDKVNVKTAYNKYNFKLLIKEVITKNKNRFNDKNIDFRFNIDSNIPDNLYGDNINLRNVINSILDNSYKYTEKGFVELNVNVIFKHDIARLIIKIEDSGIGIKADELDKCLNKNPDKENSLYGARKIITLLGGNLLINSEYGRGTIITIVLDQKIDMLNSKYDNYTYDKRIALVTNNSSNIRMITKSLDKSISIDTFDKGKTLLDNIRKGTKYDLIIMSEELPYLSGNVVMSKLMNIKNFSTPVILLSKKKNNNYKNNGFTDYITEPIDKESLVSKIDKYLK